MVAQLQKLLRMKLNIPEEKQVCCMIVMNWTLHAECHKRYLVKNNESIFHEVYVKFCFVKLFHVFRKLKWGHCPGAAVTFNKLSFFLCLLLQVDIVCNEQIVHPFRTMKFIWISEWLNRVCNRYRFLCPGLDRIKAFSRGCLIYTNSVPFTVIRLKWRQLEITSVDHCWYSFRGKIEGKSRKVLHTIF